MATNPSAPQVSKDRFVKYPLDVIEWRKHLSAIDWTVLSVINDKIYGCVGKEHDAVSKSQILDETTLPITCIKESLARLRLPDGPLEVIGRGRRQVPVYRIRPCDRSYTALFAVEKGSPADAIQSKGSAAGPLHPGAKGSAAGPTIDRKKEEEPQPAQVAELVNKQSALVTEQLPIRAASQEPPVEMLFPSAMASGSLLGIEGHVEGVLPHTCKEEVPATVSLGGSPTATAQDTPELVSSPRSWAGRPENQPAATQQTPPPVPPAPLPFEPAPAVVDDEEDEDTWTARVGAEEDLPDGGSYGWATIFV